MIKQVLKQHDAIVYRWASQGELAATITPTTRRHHEGRSWTGETCEETLDRALHGNLALVAEARNLMVNLRINLETSRPQWQAAPAGAFPVVPEVLAGFPTPMRRRVESEDSTNPIRVIVDTTTSGGISARDCQKKGLAVLGLIMALEAVRPVELTVLSVIHGGSTAGAIINLIKVPSKPLNLALAANALGSVGLCRVAGYGWVADNSTATRNNLHWGWNDATYGGNYRKLTAALAVTEHDLFVPPVYLTDEYSDPVKWVKGKLTQLGVSYS